VVVGTLGTNGGESVSTEALTVSERFLDSGAVIEGVVNSRNSRSTGRETA
jgi:hypothetical protein